MAIGWVLWGAGALAAFLVTELIYFSAVVRWDDEETVGLGYYGKSPEGRARFKARLRWHATLLQPILWLTARTTKFAFDRVSFRYRGVAGPRGSCSEATFDRAAGYQARAEDVFVVTQMKAGTTWMQYLIYEVLHRGGGDLIERGTALYAVSPWIEGRKSVSIEDAPLLGRERPSRIIKTHLPAALCPHSPAARYIYLARHPVSCFASCIDFIATNVGSLAPPIEASEAWYRSPEAMWWGTWPDHVKGWWDQSRERPGVLFVFFEEMKADLPGVTRRIAAFLGLAPLDDTELAQVVEKVSFENMRRHRDCHIRRRYQQ